MEDHGLDTAGVQRAWKESVWTEEEGRATVQGGVSKGSPQAEQWNKKQLNATWNFREDYDNACGQI